MANKIYIEDFFEDIVNDIIADISGTITSINNTTKTIYVNKTTGLINGMSVNLNGYKESFVISDVQYKSFKVTTTKTLSATSYSLNISYLFGNPIEVSNILTEKSQSADYKFKKYPCLCLFTGYSIPVNNSEPAYIEYDNLFLAIITDTKPEYSTEQRKENSFKIKLEPIYDLLFQKLNNCKYSYGLIKPDNKQFTHTRKNVYYWGSEGKDQNIINSFADAIEITNLNLKFYKNEL